MPGLVSKNFKYVVGDKKEYLEKQTSVIMRLSEEFPF